MQVGAPGNPRDRGEHGDGEQAADSGDVVVDGGSQASVLWGCGLHDGGGEGRDEGCDADPHHDHGREDRNEIALVRGDSGE